MSEDIYTYTPDMTRPNCPSCGRPVNQFDFTDEPEQPWQGTCEGGHTHWYQLEDDEEE